MTRPSFTVLVAAGLLCLSPASYAGEVAAAPEQLDELVVQGTRLWHMRKAIIDIDDRFFARYNEINKNHDFDVHCGSEAPIGTRIEERACRAAFQERAEHEWARSILTGTAAIPPEIVRLERAEAYRKNLAEVARSDPQLMKLLGQRAALEKKYRAVLAKRLQDRRVLFE